MLNEGLRIWTIGRGRKARQSYFGALIRLSLNGYLLHSTTEQGNRSLQSFAIDRSHEDHEASLTILGAKIIALPTFTIPFSDQPTLKEAEKAKD